LRRKRFIVTMTIETIIIDKSDPTPIYKQIAKQICDLIGQGALKPNQKLPTHRWLADKLDVTVGTITRSYAEVERKGFVEARVGAGTYVTDTQKDSWIFEAETTDSNECNFGYNIPPTLDRSLILEKAMKQLMSRPLQLNQLMLYQKPAGIDAHRERVTRWLKNKGFNVDAQRMLFSSGAQHGLQIVLDTFARAGDTLLVEKLTYPGVISLAKQKQLTLKSVDMDEQGVVPDALEAACRQYQTRFIYLTPTLQNPTTAIMSLERRLAILEICKKHDIFVIEDDVNGVLAEDAPPALVNLDSERVIHLGAFSKYLAPGLRVGYLYAPQALYPRLVMTLQNHSWMISPLLTALACELLHNGDAERCLATIRLEMARRLAATLRQLGDLGIKSKPGCFHAWLTLPEHWRLSDFVAAAQAQNIIVKSAELFTPPGGHVIPAVRLSLSSPSSMAQLERGVQTLNQLLTSNPVDEFTL
jgi:DNA-binding transcriptional MocR family regulator